MLNDTTINDAIAKAVKYFEAKTGEKPAQIMARKTKTHYIFQMGKGTGRLAATAVGVKVSVKQGRVSQLQLWKPADAALLANSKVIGDILPPPMLHA